MTNTLKTRSNKENSPTPPKLKELCLKVLYLALTHGAWTIRQQEKRYRYKIRKANEGALSGLQQPVFDPPPPGRAVVRSWDTAELKPRLMYFLIVSNMLPLQGVQGEHPLWDLKRSLNISIVQMWPLQELKRERLAMRIFSVSPDHWFRWLCGRPLPGGTLWSGCYVCWSLWCRRLPLRRQVHTL